MLFSSGINFFQFAFVFFSFTEITLNNKKQKLNLLPIHEENIAPKLSLLLSTLIFGWLSIFFFYFSLIWLSLFLSVFFFFISLTLPSVIRNFHTPSCFSYSSVHLNPFNHCKSKLINNCNLNLKLL